MILRMVITQLKIPSNIRSSLSQPRLGSLSINLAMIWSLAKVIRPKLYKKDAYTLAYKSEAKIDIFSTLMLVNSFCADNISLIDMRQLQFNRIKSKLDVRIKFVDFFVFPCFQVLALKKMSICLVFI